MRDWMNTLYSVPGLIIGFTVHEFCHAYVAYKLGDPTAKNQGRISLNPLKHMTIVGLFLFIFAGFGYAKPVQFSPENLQNPKRDENLIAVAGPLSNLILGVILISIFKDVYSRANMQSYFYHQYLRHLLNILLYGAYLNFSMCVFNMLPIPPLDGSHVFLSIFNIPNNIKNMLYRFGWTALILIIVVGRELNINILPVGLITNAIMKLFI
jgi:Zn-dependent protease